MKRAAPDVTMKFRHFFFLFNDARGKLCRVPLFNSFALAEK